MTSISSLHRTVDIRDERYISLLQGYRNQTPFCCLSATCKHMYDKYMAVIQAVIDHMAVTQAVIVVSVTMCVGRHEDDYYKATNIIHVLCLKSYSCKLFKYISINIIVQTYYFML